MKSLCDNYVSVQTISLQSFYLYQWPWGMHSIIEVHLQVMSITTFANQDMLDSQKHTTSPLYKNAIRNEPIKMTVVHSTTPITLCYNI